MSILLISTQATGQIRMSDGERQYVILDHSVILEGYPDDVLQRDADELLRNGLLHLPTPGEQAAFMAAQQAKTMIQE
jgi:hypothetical protein